jgi:hypothetical protein
MLNVPPLLLPPPLLLLPLPPLLLLPPPQPVEAALQFVGGAWHLLVALSHHQPP